MVEKDRGINLENRLEEENPKPHKYCRVCIYDDKSRRYLPSGYSLYKDENDKYKPIPSELCGCTKVKDTEQYERQRRRSSHSIRPQILDPYFTESLLRSRRIPQIISRRLIR